MPDYLRFPLMVCLALLSGSAWAAGDPAATAPIPPPLPGPSAPSNATPPTQLFVAPTVEPQKKPAAVQPLPLPPAAAARTAAAPAVRPAKPPKQHAAAKPKPATRHVRREREQHYARVYSPPHAPYYAAVPEPEPLMPPPGWYDRGPGPGYPYPGPPRRMGYW